MVLAAENRRFLVPIAARRSEQHRLVGTGPLVNFVGSLLAPCCGFPGQLGLAAWSGARYHRAIRASDQP